MKDYLSFEKDRNQTHAASYAELMHRAFGECQVFIGHHLSFQNGGDLATENEVPSADTLLFDHEVMTKVFGPERGVRIMRGLAALPCGRRDEFLRDMLATLSPLKEIA